MEKVSYTGNGKVKEFVFHFPYFENSNIVVTKNGAAATGYSIVGNAGGLDADIPYDGGMVIFDVAPSILDTISISRQLPLSRIADYQPTEQINPTTLNQDLNYLMEVIKDRKSELKTLTEQYSQITDAESVEVLLARVAEINQEIATISQQIADFGDMTQISTDIATLKNRTTGMLDYVVASQSPTAENGYTWYRKYKSGWVEQGGLVPAGSVAHLPITMVDSNYNVTAIPRKVSDTEGTIGIEVILKAVNLVEIGVRWQGVYANSNGFFWRIEGMGA